MLRIPISVAGDQWFNQAQVQDLLATAGDQNIELDVGAEGPSLQRLGIVDTVLAAGVDPARVFVTNWPNSVETIPFRRAVLHRVSHFFWHHRLHTVEDQFDNLTNNIFGLFVGRRTFSRCRIFYDMYQQYSAQTCMSLMNYRSSLPWQIVGSVNVENADVWAAEPEFRQWWQSPPVGSLDSAEIGDQYNSSCNTNFSLLKFYNQFDVELVCETYCYGDAFFPTEKTVRPIAAGKPFLTFGPPRFLERIKNLGFQTYSDFWDESYDQLEGVARWQAMQTAIADIARQYNRQWMQSLNTVAEYNRQHLKSIVQQYQPT